VAAITSILFYKRYKTTWLRIMPIFLSYAFINDFLGLCALGPKNNNLYYSIYSIIAFVYYLFVYYQNLKANRFKTIISIGIILYLISVVINIKYQDIMVESLVYSYCFGGGLIIMAILFYFVEKLANPKILHIKTDLLFWISVGLLLFYSGYIPIKLARISIETFKADNISIRFIHLLLVIIMNGLFSIGFIWNREN